MYKLISFILFLFYKYYLGGKGTRSIAYESAILAVLLIIGINLFVLNFYFEIIPFQAFSKNDPRWLVYLKYGLGYILPGYLILKFFFKKDTIVNLSFDEQKILKGSIALICYIILSVMLLFIMI